MSSWNAAALLVLQPRSLAASRGCSELSSTTSLATFNLIRDKGKGCIGHTEEEFLSTDRRCHFRSDEWQLCQHSRTFWQPWPCHSPADRHEIIFFLCTSALISALQRTQKPCLHSRRDHLRLAGNIGFSIYRCAIELFLLCAPQKDTFENVLNASTA